MPDIPDKNSPYLILRQADISPFQKWAHVNIKSSEIEPSKPLIIPWEPKSYGQPTDKPSDMFADSEFVYVSLSAGIEDKEPGAIMSKALYEKLNSLVPDVCKTIDVILLGPDGSKLDYVAMFPEKHLESKKLESANENDLQWGLFAFDEKEAPGELFALTLDSQTSIIVSRRVGKELGVDKFFDIMLSDFHRTPTKGGARPAIAAISRVLNKQEKLGDIETVQQAMRDDDKHRNPLD